MTAARVEILTSEGAGPPISTSKSSSASVTPVTALPEAKVASLDPAVALVLALPNPRVERESEYDSEFEERV